MSAKKDVIVLADEINSAKAYCKEHGIGFRTIILPKNREELLGLRDMEVHYAPGWSRAPLFKDKSPRETARLKAALETAKTQGGG